MYINKTSIIDGVQISFNEVYNKYYKQILAYFFKRINSTSDAEDLTSEVFLYSYKHFDKYDSEKASLSTWLYLIAKSRYYNYCRDKKNTENIDDFENLIGSYGDEMEKAIYIEELRIQLNKALNNLTDRQKNIVVMKYFEEMETEEIAEFYGTSSNNIRVQLCKALKNLRKYISDWS